MVLFPNARIVGPYGDATGFLLHGFAYVFFNAVHDTDKRYVYRTFSGVNRTFFRCEPRVNPRRRRIDSGDRNYVDARRRHFAS